MELKLLWQTFQMLTDQLDDCDQHIEAELRQYCLDKGFTPPDPDDEPQSKSDRKIKSSKNVSYITIVKTINTLIGIDPLSIDGVGGSFVLDVAAELCFTLHQFPSALILSPFVLSELLSQSVKNQYTD